MEDGKLKSQLVTIFLMHDIRSIISYASSENRRKLKQRTATVTSNVLWDRIHDTEPSTGHPGSVESSDLTGIFVEFTGNSF